MLQVTAIGEAVSAVAERLGPAVAGLGRGYGEGTGVVIAPGRILTSAHVLRGPDVAVTVGGAPAVHGQVVGVDSAADLAVIAAETDRAEPVAWDPERAAAARIGTPVFALADPGGRGLRVTFGLVSSAGRPAGAHRGRRVAGSLEHTAPLPKGSSGGPLVDAEGHLLGVNTARLDAGFVLALPADGAMRARVEALGRGEAAPRPRLGLALARTRGPGLLVRAVQEASPAAVTGLARGDLLLAADGRPLGSVDDLLDALEDPAQPTALTLTIRRGPDEHEVTVPTSVSEVMR